MRTLVLLAALFLIALPCLAAEPAGGDLIAQAQNQFAFDLYGKLAAAKGNVVFSPFSIHDALTMTWAGAGKQTALEMWHVLHLPDLGAGDLNQNARDGIGPGAHSIRVFDANAIGKLYNQQITFLLRNAAKENPPYELQVANALWIQNGLRVKPLFMAMMTKEFGGSLNSVDFAKADAARKTVNDWCAKQTHDKIKEILPAGSVDELTRLVLTNAIYLKAPWQHPFAKESTKKDPFYASGKEKVQAPTMHAAEARLQIAKGKDASLLVLPYAGGDLEMLIVLPAQRDGLPALEKGLSAKMIDDLRKQAKDAAVNVALPKFKIESSFELNGPLKKLGMKLALDPDKADFSGMSAEKLFISKVLHKGFIDVNEAGTEAAAATAVVAELADGYEPSEIVPFVADHPFLYAVRSTKDGSILFLGRMVDPR